MAAQQQSRDHAGHSHGHSDNSYLTSTNKQDAGVRITRIGLYVNLGMAIGKGVGGYYFNSQALLADGLHSLTDLISDVLTLSTVSWSLKPPSERFPSGYGKVESLGALGVSGVLLGGGILMGWAALMSLLQQFLPESAHMLAELGFLGHSHAHSHSEMDLGPNINAAWLAGGSILIKEWLYRKTMAVARERKSSVLASNAYHHRVDSLTAFVALLMIGGSKFLENASWLDPVGGLVISLMVIQAGWGNTKASLFELADVGVDEGIRKATARAASKALEELPATSAGKDSVEIRHVQGVKAGQNFLMDLELAVPGSCSIEETQDIEKAVRARVGTKVRGVRRVRVRFVPKETDDAVHQEEFIGIDVSQRSSPEPEEDPHEHDHDHEHAHAHSHSHDQTTYSSVAKRR